MQGTHGRYEKVAAVDIHSSKIYITGAHHLYQSRDLNRAVIVLLSYLAVHRCT